jgi:hypothetical protein
MSILKTFLIQFTSNAAQVTEETKRLENATVQAEAKIKEGSESSTKAQHGHKEAVEETSGAFDKLQEHARESFKSILEQTAEVFAAWKALVGVERLIDNFFEQAERSDQLGEQAKQLGVNIETLDQWQNMVQRVGGSAEGFAGSLEHVNVQLERASFGKGGGRIKPFLTALGIDIHDAKGQVKTAFELIEELPKKIEGMDHAKSGALLKGIGFDEGTIRLLQRGGKEVDEMIERQKRLGLITKEDAEIAESYNIEWMDVKQLFRNLVVVADSLLLPALESILEGVVKFIDFLRDHKPFVIGFAVALGVLATAFVGLDAVVGVFEALLSPVLLAVVALVALATALAFVYDDLVNFAEGNKSLIGELAKRWPKIGEIAHNIVNAFHRVKEGFASDFEHVKANLALMVQFWENAFNAIASAFANPKKAWQDFKDTVSSAIVSLIAQFPGLGAAFHAVFDGVDNIIKSVISGFNNMVDAFALAINKLLGIANLIPGVHLGTISANLPLPVGMGSPAPFGLPVAAPLAATGALADPRLAATREPYRQHMERPSVSVGEDGQLSAPSVPSVPSVPYRPAFLPLPSDKIAATNAQIGIANSSLAQTTQPIPPPSNVTNNNTLSVGNVTIQTQATDANGVAESFADKLKQHYEDVISNNYASGYSH